MQATLSPYSTPGYRRNTIDEGFIATLIDGGPALLGVILACTQLAVITWGIYGDIVSAFLLAESTRFVTLAAMATVIIATASYMFGRLAESDDKGFAETSNGNPAKASAPADSEDLSWPAESNLSEFGAAMDGYTAASMTVDQHSNRGPALRTRFFSEVANELRTPITSICLAARIIRKHHASTPEVVERFGETLVNDATRLGELVNEFLELVRLESGRVSWRDEDVPVLELMQTAESYLSELAQVQQRRIAVHVDGDLPPLNCDRERIVQVLTVLLSTAFSSTAKSDAIGLYAFQHHGRTIFSISPELGDPLSFRRGGESTVPANRSASEEAVAFAIPTLTFNICQEIIAHYGGCISAEQRGNDVTVFRVTIPQSRSQQCASPDPVDYAAAQADEALTPARPMVLAEEDTAVQSGEERTAASDVGVDEDDPAAYLATQQTVEAPEERHGLEALSAEQAEELLSLPANYAANNDIQEEQESAPEVDGISSLAPLSDDDRGPHTDIDLSSTDTEATSQLDPAEETESESESDILITPPPALASSTAVAQLPAPQSAGGRQAAGVPAIHASTIVAEVAPAAGPLVVTDAAAPATTSVTQGGRRGTMIDPPIAGVGPDEDWHAEANNHPTHRSPAPWLAERLRQAAGSSIAREHKPSHEEAPDTTQSSAAEQSEPIATPISRLRGHDQRPPAASSRAQAPPSSSLIHRRKLGS